MLIWETDTYKVPILLLKKDYYFVKYQILQIKCYKYLGQKCLYSIDDKLFVLKYIVYIVIKKSLNL